MNGTRYILFLLLFISASVSGQTRLRGQVVDAHGEPLPGIVAKAFGVNAERMLAYAISNGEGHYEIELGEGLVATRVVLAGMGYRQLELAVKEGQNNLGRSIMEEAELELKEVTVKAPPVHVKSDTITYIVDQMKDKSDRTIEDVIKKIPGVEVDQQGRIKYQGEDINKFYIEGIDMLGGRYTLATQNKQAALNLKMKRSSMLRPIVTATVGAGYGDDPLWLAEATGLFIAPKKQFLLTAKGNNAGSFYDKESTDFFAGNLFPIPLARDMLSSAASNNAHISRDRYIYNRSATGSLNSI